MLPKQALLAKLTKIFADAVVDDDEKASLRAFLGSGELSPDEIREVFGDFMTATWKDTMEDGHVTDEERQRLRELVRVLGLDEKAFPPGYRAALVDPPRRSTDAKPGS